MAEAIFSKDKIVVVTTKVVEEIKARALASPRKRFRLCMHSSEDHLTQEMLIAFHKDTYMPPHRHPKGKSESYHIVEGSMTVFLFNDKGNVIDRIQMAQYGSGKPFLYRLSGSIWHMPVPTSEWLVYHETYTGPFVKENDVEFPDWAPKEEDKKQIIKFLGDLSDNK